MPRVKTNTTRIPIDGIDGDAFESGTLQFSHLEGTFRTGEELLLRKRPGRTSGHQILVPADVSIPEPERATEVSVSLYDDAGRLVASGTDTVAPPGSDVAVTDPDRMLRHLDAMVATIEAIQGTLWLCKGDLCATVLEHSFARMDYTQTARRAVEAGEYAAVTDALQSVKAIVEGDIELLETEGESTTHDDVLALEYDLLRETTAALRAASSLR